MRNTRQGSWCGVAVVLIAALTAIGGLSGCSTLDRAYRREVSWTNAPVVRVVTNEVVVARAVPVAGGPGGGGGAGGAPGEVVRRVETNFVPVFWTNFVQVPVTNLVARPEAEEAIQGVGAVVNAFAPGLG